MSAIRAQESYEARVRRSLPRIRERIEAAADRVGREGDGVYMKARKVVKSPAASKMSVLAFLRPGVEF